MLRLSDVLTYPLYSKMKLNPSKFVASNIFGVDSLVRIE